MKSSCITFWSPYPPPSQVCDLFSVFSLFCILPPRLMWLKPTLYPAVLDCCGFDGLLSALLVWSVTAGVQGPGCRYTGNFHHLLSHSSSHQVLLEKWRSSLCSLTILNNTQMFNLPVSEIKYVNPLKFMVFHINRSNVWCDLMWTQCPWAGNTQTVVLFNVTECRH